MLYRASEVHCFGCVQGEGIGGEEGEGNWGMRCWVRGMHS